MAGLGLAKKVGLTALGLGTGGAAGNIEFNLQATTRFYFLTISIHVF